MAAKTQRGQAARFILITGATVLLRMALQPLIPTESSQLPPSIIAQQGYLPVAFLLYAFLAYGLLGLLFVFIQVQLPWTRTKKGMAYGLALGLLWAVYFFEPLPYNLNYRFSSTLAFSFADGVSIIFLGVLLGWFLASDSPGWGKQQPLKWILTIITVSGFLIVGRLVEYYVFNIFSAYIIKPFDTLVWVATTGVWTAIAFLVLSARLTAKSAFRKAVYFGILIFGVNLVLFNGFLAIAVTVDLVDLCIRTLIDILFVSLGVTIVAALENKIAKRQHSPCP